MPYAVTPIQVPGSRNIAGPSATASSEIVTTPVAPTTALYSGRRRSHQPMTALGDRWSVGSGNRRFVSAAISRRQRVLENLGGLRYLSSTLRRQVGARPALTDRL